MFTNGNCNLRSYCRLAGALGIAFLLLSAAAGQTIPDKTSQGTKPGKLPYQDASLPIQARVTDLLQRMTLDEKVNELVWTADSAENKVQVIDPTQTYTDKTARQALAAEWGPEIKLTPRNAAILRNGVQRYLREKTRLGIPALFFGEGLHGYMEYGSTSFPETMGMASTWDPELVKRVYTAIADEASSRGADQLFAPDLDIARDPRWGRTEETYGEDPYLVSRMGVAMVEGLQGDSFAIDRHHVMATAKHFAVHGQPEGGTNTAPGNYSERIIRENFLVPFEAAVKEAHVGSVMVSYNEIDGVPSSINHWLIGQNLRHDWGFDGYAISDDAALNGLIFTHHVAHDSAEAARLALDAGVDFDLADYPVYRTLIAQVKQNLVPESKLDQAVARVLAAKFRLGLFDHPYVDPDYAERVNNSPEHRQLALEAARKAFVLLKNEKNLLPLDLSKLNRIAVIGPNAADVHLGGYSRDPGFGISILDGIRARAGDKATVLYSQGCKVTTAPPGYRGFWADGVKLVDPATQTASIQEAAEAARKADVAILVVGEDESTDREAWSEGHLGDRDSLDLLGAQDDLVKAVVATGTPTVVILSNGRPLSIDYIAQSVPAILEGWFPGEEGGAAAAEVLFGDVNPGGKLPITFPHSVGDLPDYYNHKPSANRGYEFGHREPLFAFGYGLSYTTFKFDNLRVEPAQIAAGGRAKVSVEVTNTGAREGDEAPQLYLHQEVASVTQPVMQLKGFERITLKPGERRTVEFTITSQMLSIFNLDMKRVVEPGDFDLMVGPSSVDTKTVKLTVAASNTSAIGHGQSAP
ncbi:MAG: glycoside hydrolase family 3 N-terminal domain-containing protein [Terracidiphilus sp.]